MEVLKFTDDYLISDSGRVLSLKYQPIRELKQEVTKVGYTRVTFSYGRKVVRHLVHRLVAKAFIPNPEDKRTVNHKDGNRQNNCLDNLEWATHSENHLHAFRVLGKKPNLNMLGKRNELHKRSKPVVQSDKAGVFIKVFPSIQEAERQTGSEAKNISSVCLGKLKTCNGFKWRFANA